MAKAQIINKRCIEFDLELGYNFRIANDFKNSSVIYAMTNDYKNAIEEAKEAVKYYLKDDRPDRSCAIYTEMVTLYLKDNDIIGAEQSFTNAEDLIKNRNLKFIEYEDYLSFKHASFYINYKSDRSPEALKILDEVLGASGKYDIPSRDIASFHQNRGLTLRRQGNYEDSYLSFSRAYRIYEEYDDVSKKVSGSNTSFEVT
ncbi:MAG: hypothetical protein R2685_03950 [Candidatus Nitrosocosmicus sp.]|nr:hypothetical protein [Candidatus Nitrosocosmicus sp.]